MKRRVLLGSTIILILIAVTASMLFIWIPLQVRRAFENFWFDVMRNLNSPETKANVTSWFDRDLNFTEIYDWVHENLEFVPENETLEKRYTDPSKIREYGKGRCQEFSILYVAACLSHGYQSRIVVSVDIGIPWFLNGKHAWAEVMLEGWVHVDPSDKVWNEPYRYETWDWGRDIGSNIQIYAFEEGKYEDVTLKYKRNYEKLENRGDQVSLNAFIGVLIGSGISILVTYLTHRWTEKRERQKIEIELEKEAISQIFSPLVFILNNVRDLFAKVMALHNTLQKMSKTGERDEEVVTLLSYLTVKGTTRYPQALENMLLHKSGLIKSPQFYLDLVVLQSYLSTIVTFVSRLISRSDKSLLELKRYLSALAPLVIQLDKAISEMREYAMAKTARLQKYRYKQFFTEEKYSELESYLDEANKILVGERIPEWHLLLKQFQSDTDNDTA